MLSGKPLNSADFICASLVLGGIEQFGSLCSCSGAKINKAHELIGFVAGSLSACCKRETRQFSVFCDIDGLAGLRRTLTFSHLWVHCVGDSLIPLPIFPKTPPTFYTTATFFCPHHLIHYLPPQTFYSPILVASPHPSISPFFLFPHFDHIPIRCYSCLHWVLCIPTRKEDLLPWPMPNDKPQVTRRLLNVNVPVTRGL